MNIPRRKPYFAKGSLIKFFKLILQSKESLSKQSEKLEKTLHLELRIPNPVVVVSGRAGLQLILEESEIKKGSEIIIPGYTFGILKSVIKSMGFIPKPVDIDPETFQMAPIKVKGAVTKKTAAILATHLLGEPCDIEKILKIAQKNKLIVIEDCAQALGATKNGRQVGTFGDVAISSFNIAKPLQGITGGLVFGKDKALIERIRERVKTSDYNSKNIISETFRGLTGYFLTQTIFWYILMFLFSFKSFQETFVKAYRSVEVQKSSKFCLHPAFAYLIRLNIANFGKRLAKRRNARLLYQKVLGKDVNFQKILSGDMGSVDMLVATIGCNTYDLRGYLALRKVDIAIRDEIADDCLKVKDSNTAFVSKNAIALPLYEDINPGEIMYVSSKIKDFLKNLQTIQT